MKIFYQVSKMFPYPAMVKNPLQNPGLHKQYKPPTAIKNFNIKA